MTIDEIEEMLKLRAWGMWARPYYGLNAKPPGWAKFYKPRYPRESKPPPEITDEEGLELDALICGSLDDIRRRVVVSYYSHAPDVVPSERAVSRYLRLSRRRVKRYRREAIELIWLKKLEKADQTM